MAETPLADLPLATLRQMLKAAMEAARSASGTERDLYRLGTAGTHAERREGTAERRAAWARVNAIQDAIRDVHRQGEMVQPREYLL